MITWRDDAPGGPSAHGLHKLLSAPYERLYALQAAGVRPKSDGEYRLHGTCLHLLQAFHWAGRMESRPAWWRPGPEAALAELHRVTAGHPLGASLRDEALAFDSYYRRAAAVDSWLPIAVEREYILPLSDLPPAAAGLAAELGVAEETVTARVDLVVRIGGRVSIVDHKSVRGTGQTLSSLRATEAYEQSLQVPWLRLLLRMLWPEEQGCVVIQRLKRNVPFHYSRDPIDVPPHLIDEAAVQVVRLVAKEKELKAKLARGEPPASCFGLVCDRFRACDYWPICSAPPAQRATVIAAEYSQR